MSLRHLWVPGALKIPQVKIWSRSWPVDDIALPSWHCLAVGRNIAIGSLSLLEKKEAPFGVTYWEFPPNGTCLFISGGGVANWVTRNLAKKKRLSCLWLYLPREPLLTLWWAVHLCNTLFSNIRISQPSPTAFNGYTPFGHLKAS